MCCGKRSSAPRSADAPRGAQEVDPLGDADGFNSLFVEPPKADTDVTLMVRPRGRGRWRRAS